MQRPVPCAWLSLFLVAACLGACDELGEFRTGQNRVFRGEVISSDSQQDETSFRHGFGSHTQMELTFDPVLAAVYPAEDPLEAAPPTSPGAIHSYSCPAKDDACAKKERIQGDFDHAALEPIPNLAHDALSQYDFPGGGRIKNYIFGVRFTSDLDGAPLARYATAFLSLMASGRVEVRVIAPSILSADGKSEALSPLFGVFVLEMQRK